MLNLSKAVLMITVGFIFSVILGMILIPILRKFKFGQRLSTYLSDTHKTKSGTPTMGGFIFIIPTILTILLLVLFKKISFSYNFFIVLFTFISYAIIGFIDDYLIIKRNNNNGLSEKMKLTFQIIVAIIFFYLFFFEP